MKIPHRFFIFFNFLLDLLFPWQCLYCQKEVENNYPLCQNCFQKIPIFNDFLCPVCQKQLASNSLSCRSCHSKTPLTALGAASSYHNNILKETLHYFKYKKIISLAEPLSALMITFLEQSSFFSTLPKDKLLIIPIPLHFKKERQRGFNQATLLAQSIANHFHLPLSNNCLIRIINNPPQAFITIATKRKENIQGVFQIQNKEIIKNKIILLIDDVYTTGATMGEAAKLLKQNGAKKIIGLVLAKG